MRECARARVCVDVCARVHFMRTVNACVHTPICTALSSLREANGSRAIVNS